MSCSLRHPTEPRVSEIRLFGFSIPIDKAVWINSWGGERSRHYNLRNDVGMTTRSTWLRAPIVDRPGSPDFRIDLFGSG
jgi:hypothetical protein